MTTKPTEITLSSLANKETGDIVRKKVNLRIQINGINNPHDWWFYACKICWKKMVLAGSVRKCPDCGGTEDEQRYKLSINAKDVQSTDKGNKVIADFVLFGKHGTALTGKEAALLAAQTRGRLDFVPPAIANIVGKEYAVTAEVKQDTYDAEPGHIILKVSRAELITPSAAAESPSNYSDPRATKETNTPTGTSGTMENQPERDNDLEATPIKDIMNLADDGAEEEITSATNGSSLGDNFCYQRKEKAKHCIRWEGNQERLKHRQQRIG